MWSTLDRFLPKIGHLSIFSFNGWKFSFSAPEPSHYVALNTSFALYNTPFSSPFAMPNTNVDIPRLWFVPRAYSTNSDHKIRPNNKTPNQVIPRLLQTECKFCFCLKRKICLTVHKNFVIGTHITSLKRFFLFNQMKNLVCYVLLHPMELKCCIHTFKRCHPAELSKNTQDSSNPVLWTHRWEIFLRWI